MIICQTARGEKKKTKKGNNSIRCGKQVMTEYENVSKPKENHHTSGTSFEGNIGPLASHCNKTEAHGLAINAIEQVHMNMDGGHHKLPDWKILTN